MLVFCKLNAVCAVLLNTSWLPGFTLTPLCLLSRRAGCQQYVLKSMSNPWCLRIELVWATLQKASISSYFSRSVLWVTLQMMPQGQLTAITISAQLKGALPLLGEILVHLKVSFWHRQLTQKGDSVCLAAALALTIFKFYSSISCHKKCPTLAMGKTAKKVYTQWGKKKERQSWTPLEPGKYFNVCFAQDFVLAAVVVTVVTGCIGIFLGFDFQEGVPQVERFALQDKSQALPKSHKHTPVFGRLDTVTCCRANWCFLWSQWHCPGQCWTTEFDPLQLLIAVGRGVNIHPL